MKFSAICFAAGLIAAVTAIPSSAPYSTGTTSAPVATATSSYPIAVQQCLDSCPATDTTCRALCLSAPAPSNQQANDTTKCVSGCDKGDGSKAATDKYSECVQSCIKQYYLPTQGAGSGNSQQTGTGTGATATATGTATGTGSNSGSNSGSKSNPTGSSSNSTSTHAASSTANGLSVRTLFGSMIAIVAVAIAL